MENNPYKPPSLDTSKPNKSMPERLIINLLRLWNGKVSLSVAFWGIFIFGNIIYLFSFALISRTSKYLFGYTNFIQTFDILAMSIWGIYLILTIKFLWSCAKNTKYSGFYYLIRFSISILIIMFIFSFFQIIWKYYNS